MISKALRRTVVSLAAVVAFAAPAMAETPVGSNVDSRVLIGLKVNPDAVQDLMPDGWQALSWPGGAMGGANLLVSLIDGMVEMNPEGAPLDPPNRRAMVLVGLARDGEAVRAAVLQELTTVPERNPYSVASPAAISRTRTLTEQADGPRTISDTWTIAPESGGTVTISLDYTAGNRGWSAGEALPYSAADPTFSRIYRYEQMVDLVVSDGLGKPASGSYSLSSDVDMLAGLFDGSEEIVTVIDVPVYVRDVSLP